MRYSSGFLFFVGALANLQLAGADPHPYSFGHATFGTDLDGSLAAVGDFNGDGRIDLVGLNSFTQKVTVLLGQENGGFEAAPPTNTGAQPSAAAAADLNGDGKLDLAIANVECDQSMSCPGSVLILYGRGDGTFDVGPKPPTAPVPLAVAVADLDGDGAVDLAVAAHISTIDSGASGKVTILLSMGDGNFKAGGDFAAGNGVDGVLAARMDDDAALDLVIVQNPSLSNDAIAWLPGKGDGSFLEPKSIQTGTGPQSVAAADLDGDGKTDLVVTRAAPFGNIAGGTLSVLFGDGKGFFKQTDYAALIGSGKVAIDDLNGDGLLDLIVLSTPPSAVFSGDISVRFGKGGGDFADEVDVVAGDAGRLATGDFNHDGKLDLAVGGRYSVATVLLGGSQGLAAPTLLQLDAFTLIQEGDTTGDGKLDLIATSDSCTDACSCTEGEIQTYPGGGDGTFAFTQPVMSSGWGHLASIAVGDFNNDHKLDLVALEPCTPMIGVSLGDGAGGFGAPKTQAISASLGVLLPRDLDGDGKLDLVVSSTFDSWIAVLRGHGDGTFEPEVDYDTAPGPAALTAADFNGDGRLDLAVVASSTPVSYRDPGIISVLLGNSDGSFQPHLDAEIGSITPYDLVAGKLDSDDIVDLAVLGRLGSEYGPVVTLIGKGDGTFTFPDFNNQASLVTKEPIVMTSGDYDGDGKLDLVVGSYSSDMVRLMLGRSDGSFAPASGYGPAGGGALTLLAGDLNADGAPDLVAVGNAGYMDIYVSGCPGYPCGAVVRGDGGTEDGGAADGSMVPPPHHRHGCDVGRESGGSGGIATLAVALALWGYRRRRRTGDFEVRGSRQTAHD